MNRTSLADWITIITGPITLISAIAALFNNNSPSQNIQFSTYEATALIIILTVMNFLFFFEISLRLPKIVTQSGFTSLPKEFAYFLSHIACLFLFIAMQLLFISRTVAGICDPSLLLVLPSVFWLVIGYLIAADRVK